MYVCTCTHSHEDEDEDGDWGGATYKSREMTIGIRGFESGGGTKMSYVAAARTVSDSNHTPSLVGRRFMTCLVVGDNAEWIYEKIEREGRGRR